MTRRVLAVDDDPDVLELVGEALAEVDVEVRGAGTGEEALNHVAGWEPDLILLDVRLPSMDGLEVLAVLNDRGVDVPVVLFSSHTTMEITIEAMQEGAYDYLDKPLRPSRIVAIVREVLDRSRGEGVGVERPEGGEPGDVSRLIGKSDAMVDVYKTIGRVARENATVLVTGESGTGKELVARVVHRKSSRHDEPFQVVNCAAIPEGLLESELFGHEEGAFTGASERQMGKFEMAREGTLFLDEVGELPLSLQPKILRALEEREIHRLGGEETIDVGARVVAATNRNLETMVEAGDFREDLYFRLAVVRVDMPPLREREEDIPLLVDHFLEQLSPSLARSIEGAAPETYEALRDYRWPGNVRELRNVIERSLILGRGSVLEPSDLPRLRHPGEGGEEEGALKELARQEASLDEVEREYISRVLERTGGNQSEAARVLGIHRSTLRRKIDEYGLEVPA